MRTKILIANRGEIALRVVRACRELGLASVVVYSEADRDTLPVRLADEAVCIGGPRAADSYLRTDRILSAAELTGATAIHPGYGFLSESAQFAELCRECGFVFIGPSPEAIRALGDKTVARRMMMEAGVPVTPGSDGVLADMASAYACAERLGYPVMLKAASGGGGKGMRVVESQRDLERLFRAASSEAEKAFGDGSMFMEKLAVSPKHVEVQVMGDGQGHVVHFGDRDCSLQRRHQKLIEESPCATLSPELRAEMCATAVRAASSINYCGAGTIEYLLDGEGRFSFMEMNTRIQVEHPVTEMVTGVDLVQMQIRIALGEPLWLSQDDVRMSGHAIEVRLNAEDPARGFAPSPGRVSFYSTPGGPGVRLDSHLHAGSVVSPYYDSMLGKLIVHGPTREEAIVRMRRALREYLIEGVPSTRPFAERLLESPEFVSGRYTTGYVSELLAGDAAR